MYSNWSNSNWQNNNNTNINNSNFYNISIYNNSNYYLNNSNNNNNNTNWQNVTTTGLNLWSLWYTTSCVMRRTRYRKDNSSIIEVDYVTITDLNKCDMLDGTIYV